LHALCSSSHTCFTPLLPTPGPIVEPPTDPNCFAGTTRLHSIPVCDTSRALMSASTHSLFHVLLTACQKDTSMRCATMLFHMMSMLSHAWPVVTKSCMRHCFMCSSHVISCHVMSCHAHPCLPGEIPRVCPFETGFPPHATQWTSDPGSWEHDPLLLDERCVAVKVRADPRSPSNRWCVVHHVRCNGCEVCGGQGEGGVMRRMCICLACYTTGIVTYHRCCCKDAGSDMW
jgi:hypothetical protein